MSALLGPFRLSLLLLAVQCTKDSPQAAKKGQGTARLDHLLSQGANIDTADRIGLTALYYAAFRSNVENGQFLLQRGADVNAQHNTFGHPIFIAALRGQIEVVRLLLQHKASLEMPSALVGSAMHCAYYNGSVSTIELLDRPIKQPMVNQRFAWKRCR